MSLNTLYPFNFSYADIRPSRQGRSTKKLRVKFEHDGVLWVARYEGRPCKFFGASRQEAHNNLQAGMS